MSENLIKALEETVKMLCSEATSVECSSYHEYSRKAAAQMNADATLIRAHVDELKAKMLLGMVGEDNVALLYNDV